MPNSKFKYYENDFEMAVLDLLNKANYEYICGYDIHREQSSIIYEEDFKSYLNRYHLNSEEYRLVKSYLENYNNANLYRASKETYNRLITGLDIKRQNGSFTHIDFIDFNNTSKNIFRAINQYEFNEHRLRRPDIIIFINGIPISVFELKNPADEDVDISDAFDQTTRIYAEDIPNLMRFDFINVISDGVNNKYGSLFSSYEFYFKWNSPDGVGYSNSDGVDSLKRMISGLFNHENLLKILRYYIYYPDTSDKNVMVVPKYYQYYGSESMYRNIVKVFKDSSNSSKGGTYWGATGCGKSYMMLFLSKRITLCSELNKPTILLVTDRTDLDEQLSNDFENAKQYLVDINSRSIENRGDLLQSLSNIRSGGIYLMTIQKFSEDINKLSDRRNIIIISDEAHRTQTNTQSSYRRTGDKFKKTHPFGECIRNSFPNAIYVGFTGTPVDATLRTFGGIVDKYTMKQSKDDGSTVGISRISGPREVMLDEKWAQACDAYYRAVEEQGANEHQIEASKREMLKIKTILEVPNRLDIVVKHFIWHYELRCANNSTVNQKAMFVCYDREIAFKVYKKIKELRPEWFVKRAIAPEYEGESPNVRSIPIEKVKMIATVNQSRDSQELKDLLGTEEDRKKYAREFKDEKSNFKIAILVDMWITGFDVPSLDTMYLDKPVETHNLIQTISRVNRVFKNKDGGLIVDYIGLEGALATAMRLYNGDVSPVESEDVAYIIFKDFLSKTVTLLNDFDYSKFFDEKLSELDRLDLIQKSAEFVMAIKDRETNFMAYVLRIKKAFDICSGDPRMKTKDIDLLQYFVCVRSYIFKLTTGETPDTVIMNKKISELVNKAITSTYSGESFELGTKDDITDIFSDEFIQKISNIKMPFTKYQALLKLLKKAIREFGKTNRLKAGEFSVKLKKIVDKYNSRNEIDLVHDVVDDVMEGLSDELQKLFTDLKNEKESFEDLGITYDEKAFFDIIVAVSDKYNFREKYTDEKLIEIAKQIKVLVSNKSKYTDWTNRNDIRDELYSDVVKLLYNNGFPPTPIDDAYNEIMKQIENFKQYVDMR